MDQPLKQKWTPEKIDEFISKGHLWKKFLADAHNAELEEYKYKAWMYDQLCK